MASQRPPARYLTASDRAVYATESSRVVRPGGRLLVRASLRAVGVSRRAAAAARGDPDACGQLAGLVAAL